MTSDMLMLGLETSTGQAGVAIGGPEGVIASCHWVHGRRHAETLAPAIDFVCRQIGIELGHISIVAVDIGPGLFTGLRVGLATAKAIAHAQQVPLVGVSSLDLLAYPARITDRRIVSVVDALRAEVYCASYASTAQGVRRITEPIVTTATELADRLRSLNEECLIVGNGARRYANILSGVSRAEIAGTDFQFPAAESLIEVATAKAVHQSFISESPTEIMYLREPYIHPKRREQPPS